MVKQKRQLEKTTILYVDHTAKWSGGEIALLRLLAALDKNIFRPIVVLAEAGELVARLEREGIQAIVLPLPPDLLKVRKDTLGVGGIAANLFLRSPALLQYARQVADIVRQEKAAILHCNSLKSDVYGAMVGKIVGIPTLWHIRDHISTDYLPKSTVQAIRTMSRHLPTQVLCNSQSTLRSLFGNDEGATKSAIQSGRYTVVHDCVDDSFLRLPEPPIRDQWTGESIRIGIVGRLTEWKGQHIFLQAAARLIAESLPKGLPPLRFVIAGGALFQEEGYERLIREQAAELFPQGEVEWQGNIDDVPRLLSELDILVHASITPEPFGQAVIEGMAAGLPIIATAAGGILETVSDGRTGLLIPMADATALAGALRTLLSDPALANRLGRAGYTEVRERFTAKQTAATVESVYTQLLTRPVRSADSTEVPVTMSSSTPRTILYLDHTANWSGGEIALSRLISALDRSAFCPVVVLGEEGPLADRLRAMEVETHIVGLGSEVKDIRKDSLGIGGIAQRIVHNGPALLRYAQRIAAIAHEKKALLLHCNSLKSDIYGAIAGKLAGYPVLWHVRDFIDPSYLPRTTVMAFRNAARILPAHILTNSQATRDCLFPDERDRRKTSVIHNGLTEQDLDFVEPAPYNSWAGKDRIRIGLIGRLTRWKGQHILIEAATQIEKERKAGNLPANLPSIQFVFAGGALFGEEEYEREIKKQAESISNQIEWMGMVKEIPSLLRSLDIMVHTSITPEPFGQVVIEGMAAGLPIIATAGGGVKEILQDGETGLLVPMGDAAALSIAIRSLLTDPARASRLGRAGYAEVRKRFTARYTAEKVEAVYRMIAAG